MAQRNKLVELHTKSLNSNWVRGVQVLELYHGDIRDDHAREWPVMIGNPTEAVYEQIRLTLYNPHLRMVVEVTPNNEVIRVVEVGPREYQYAEEPLTEEKPFRCRWCGGACACRSEELCQACHLASADWDSNQNKLLREKREMEQWDTNKTL